MQEEWKVYKETKRSNRYRKAGIYEVSNFGRVRLNGQIIEPYDHHGYCYIAGFFVHRAVAELFVPNPENKPFVDHIDTNPKNNYFKNLRWVTHKENCNNPLTKKHISKSRKNVIYTDEIRHKMSESMKKKNSGKNNGMYGKPSRIRGKHRVYNNPNDHTVGYHYE